MNDMTYHSLTYNLYYDTSDIGSCWGTPRVSLALMIVVSVGVVVVFGMVLEVVVGEMLVCGVSVNCDDLSLWYYYHGLHWVCSEPVVHYVESR